MSALCRAQPSARNPKVSRLGRLQRYRPRSGATDRRWEQPVMDNTGRLLIYVKFTDGSTSQVLAP